MTDRDVTFLPAPVRDAARVLSNGEVMWPVSDVEVALGALATAGRVVLGTDVRDYRPDGTFIEVAWSSFQPVGVDDVTGGHQAALDALQRGPIPGGWVLVTWQ